MIDEDILYRDRRLSAEAAAADHLSLRLMGQDTAADREQFDQARAQNPELDLAWQRLNIIWDASLDVKEDPRIAAMRTRARAARPAATRFNQFRQWAASIDNLRPAAMAAALVVAVGFSVGSLTGIFGSGSGDDSAELAQWSAPQRGVLGKVESLQLADGSTVRMGGQAVIRTAIDGKARRVDLQQGEAFFDVARDEDARFTVQAGGVTVTALGTAFAVQRADDLVSVTLAHGAVRVDSKGDKGLAVGTFTLSPGQQLRITPTGFTRSEVDIARETSWTTGMLDFQNRPLEQVIAEVNRYQARQIALKDGRIRTVPITGIFPVGDSDALVEFLESQSLAKVVSRTDEQIILAGQ